MKLYFDVCCLNRPFDDQTQDRIHMEAEAINAILGHIDSSEWCLVNSGVLNYEIDRTKDIERKARLHSLVVNAGVFVTIDHEIQSRAAQIQQLGIRAYDALNVACAEKACADVLLSTDDRLVKIAKRNREMITIDIENPLVWLQKMM